MEFKSFASGLKGKILRECIDKQEMLSKYFVLNNVISSVETFYKNIPDINDRRNAIKELYLIVRESYLAVGYLGNELNKEALRENLEMMEASTTIDMYTYCRKMDASSCKEELRHKLLDGVVMTYGEVLRRTLHETLCLSFNEFKVYLDELDCMFDTIVKYIKETGYEKLCSPELFKDYFFEISTKTIQRLINSN